MILARELGNGNETTDVNEEHTIRVVHTPGVLYEEPEVATNNAQSDFYSEAGMSIHTVTNAMYGMNNQLSTNNEYVSYHFLMWYNYNHISVIWAIINKLQIVDTITYYSYVI